MLKNKKILVTGGLGFIGFNAVQHFSRENSVCVIDDCSRTGVEQNVNQLKKLNVQFAHGDISRLKEIETIFYSFNPDIVIHLAAQVAVTLSIENPLRDFQSNVLASFNLLDLARTSRKKPIILYASTNKVYGCGSQGAVLKDGRYAMRSGVNYSENSRLSFETPYGCSKGAADQYFRDYARTYSIPTVVFRQSCIYGPHQQGMEDQGWVAWFAICSLFSKSATIFGDGNQVRDVLYVDDLIQLYEKAIINIDAVKGEVFNIGGGPSNTLSINELVRMLNEKTGGSLDIAFDNWRLGDQKVYISDINKAEKLLGWKPSTAPDEGIQKLLDWINLNREHISIAQKNHAATQNKFDVSLVIPARNEEECLASVLDEVRLMLDRSSYRIEVIVVNDRSTDRTVEIAGQYPFVKLISSKHKPGKGGALRSGFDAANGTYIAMMDADFSHNALDLPYLIEEARIHKGLVIGSRILGGSEEYTRVRGGGNVFLTWFFGFFHGRYLSDVLNGFKVFHRDIYTAFEYTSPQFEIEIELAVNAVRLSREIKEVPSRERARLAGKMKSSVLRHGPRFFGRIIFEYFRKPKRGGNSRH